MLEHGSGPRIRRLVHGAVWAAALAVFGYHLLLELRSVPLQEPMGMWDTIYASIARTWPHQYQWGNYVLGHDNYGPGYPAFCRPFIALIGNVYVAHRAANVVALAASCILLGWLLRSNRCPAYAAAGLLSVFFALNAGSYSIQARPDFLVLLLILSVLAVGQLGVVGRLSAPTAGVWIGLLSLAGYLTKPYALFGWGAAIAGLWAFVGFRFAAVAGLLSAAVVAAGMVLVASLNPLYLIETFYAHVAHTSRDAGWLAHQTADFSELAFAPVAAALIAGVAWARARRAPPDGVRGGAGADRATAYWALVLGLALLVLVASLGWHTGAYLTYYYHLALGPLCVCAVAAFIPRIGAVDAIWPALILALNLCVLMVLAPELPATDAAWTDLRADVLRQDGPVVVDFLLEPLSRERSGVTVADTGMVRYALDEPDMLRGSSPRLLRAQAEVHAFEKEQAAQMRAHPPQAIYLQCAWVPTSGGADALRIQNGLSWCAGEALRDYVGVRSFRLHPYYFATNARRQAAGHWEILVIKFMRRPQPSAGARPQ